jgi:radical SAM protein with 4Fe4S-binding SPASM domain
MRKILKIEHTQDSYAIRSEAQEFPMMCVLSFTYVCNAQCPNCPYTNSEIRANYKDRPMMSEDTFKIIADQCGKYNAWVRISGGVEPIVGNFQKRKYLTWGITDPSKSADPTPYLPPGEWIPCPFIFERLNIDSRGKVMVCGFDIAAVTDMGNIHEKSIREIWKGSGFEYYRQKHLSGKGDDIALCRECPDWKYRSWKHNYWKIVKKAEETRIEKEK